LRYAGCHAPCSSRTRVSGQGVVGGVRLQNGCGFTYGSERRRLGMGTGNESVSGSGGRRLGGGGTRSAGDGGARSFGLVDRRDRRRRRRSGSGSFELGNGPVAGAKDAGCRRVRSAAEELGMAGTAPATLRGPGGCGSAWLSSAASLGEASRFAHGNRDVWPGRRRTERKRARPWRKQLLGRRTRWRGGEEWRARTGPVNR
jgi:hypothetical protein